MTEQNQNKKPRGIRNNNPGNIRWGENWKGLDPYGKKQDTDFCVFKNSAYGIRALAKILLNYQEIYGLNTIRSIITRYAPPTENQTLAYISSVASQLCHYPDEPLNLKERGVLTVFIKAIIRIENGMQPYSDDTIQQGIDLL